MRACPGRSRLPVQLGLIADARDAGSHFSKMHPRHITTRKMAGTPLRCERPPLIGSALQGTDVRDFDIYSEHLFNALECRHFAGIGHPTTVEP